MTTPLSDYIIGSIPTPEQIVTARAGMGQRAAAEIVLVGSFRTWMNWERGIRAMPPGLFELFLLKTYQHPDLIVSPKRKKT